MKILMLGWEFPPFFAGGAGIVCYELTKEMVKIMVSEIKAPVIVDAGLGKPSDATMCMELGCSAVLVNTAIATASDPVKMAKAFSLATRAGRLAFLGGTNSPCEYANTSSPLTGFLRDTRED